MNLRSCLLTFAALLCIMLFIHACKKDNAIVEPAISKDYFPVDSGHEVIYDVELFTKSSFTGLWDSTIYQIKEVIAGTFLDNQNRETQRIERYIKNDSLPDWTIYKVWAANRFSTKAQREEDNIRYVKLNFTQPVGMEWNGNAENTLGTRMYRYVSIDEPFALGSLLFDSTCTVLQFEESNLIDSSYYAETYAAGVGLVFKENKDIHYNYCGNPACDSIIDAYIYREKAVSFVK
jgi:hypothetical protein